jgi:hypothetical protein
MATYKTFHGGPLDGQIRQRLFGQGKVAAYLDETGEVFEAKVGDRYAAALGIRGIRRSMKKSTTIPAFYFHSETTLNQINDDKTYHYTHSSVWQRDHLSPER